MAQAIKTFWISESSGIEFYYDRSGKMKTKLYSKVYPRGKEVIGWDYEKAGFGLLHDYDRVGEGEFRKLIEGFRK